MRGGEFAHHGVKDRSLPGGGGWGRVRAPLPHRLCSLSLHHVTPVAWHTPHLRRPVVRIPGRVILDLGQLGAHPQCGIPFLLRPEHPLLPHWGSVCCGCHGFLLGHDPGPRAVAGATYSSPPNKGSGIREKGGGGGGGHR